MPPVGPCTLTEKQITAIKTWIEQGARWEDHWSFQPPRRPHQRSQRGLRDHFDAFIVARLEGRPETRTRSEP